MLFKLFILFWMLYGVNCLRSHIKLTTEGNELKLHPDYLSWNPLPSYVPRCERISNFYGGEVYYYGDSREIYDLVFYICDEKFSLFPSIVDNFSECDKTLRWLPDPPKCYKKTQKEVPANGYSQGTNNDTLLHLQSYEVCCYKGYELKSDVYVEGKCMRITNNNGTLVPKVPDCDEAAGSCGRPESVENAVMESEYRNRQRFGDGESVQYKCKIGYNLDGSSRERRCSNGQWSSTRFTCNLITCPYIPNPEHGRRLDQNNGTGEHTEFGCRIGYRLRGQRKLLCRTDGKWLPSSPPTCDPILCPELQRVKHGRAMFQDASDGVRNKYESVAEYTCSSGYYPNGNRNLKTYKRTCQADGSWDGKEPTCDVPRCEQIFNYYGGDVTYFEDRKIYSQAFYRCDDAFSLYPKVDMSECDDTLSWTPDPPTCYKKAKVEVPENGYSQRTNNDILLHLESYSVCCNKDYELKTDIYMEEKCTRITNNNGTIVPKVPECVEARCDPYDEYKANVRYENGSKVVTKFPSRTDVYLSCKDGYDYYRGDKSMKTPLKRTCVKGKIKYGPTCQEARCLFSGYPSNEHTFHRIYLSDARLVAEDQYIHSRQTIEVFCSNKKEYELYVNTTRTYPEEFTSECKMGQFDMKKNEFPICLEKRCEPASLYKAVVKDIDGQMVKTKIPSGTIVYLSCEAGFDYYSNGRPINSSVIRQCAKGTIINAPKCEEKKCLFSGYPSNSDTYHTSEWRTVVTDSYINHNSKIAVKCHEKEGYELYVNSTQTYERKFTSECRFGVMNKKRAEFPICLEKRCSFHVFSKEVCLWTDEDSACKANESKIPSGSMVHMRCKDGSKLRRLQDGSYVEVNGSGSIRCYKGDYSKNYKCIPDKCVVPYEIDGRLSVTDIRRVSLSGGSVVEIGDYVYFNCSKAAELIYEPLNRRFKCFNGLWIEAERDRNWTLGNNGEFPTCREAICTQNCTNGGVCFKDDNCRCKHLTEGKLCEIFICDDKCSTNGGKCVGPGKCSCPTDRFGPNCEQKGCILPKQAANHQGQKKIFSPGTTLNNFFCDRGYVLSSQNGMTCRDDGSWSESVTCIKGMYQSGLGTGCTLPSHAAGYKDWKPTFSPGETLTKFVCDYGYVLSSGAGMTCRPGGSWSNIVTCIRGCMLPSTAANHRHRRQIYSPGETLNNLFCDTGYVLSSQNGMTCEKDGSWSEIVTCEKGCELPSYTAKHENRKTILSPGETLNSFFCDSGYVLSSKNGMTCRHDGSWSEIIRCIKGCILPRNAAKHRGIKTVYNAGETLNSFYCDPGYILSSHNGMTCRQGGSWSEIVTCTKGSQAKCRYTFDAGHKWFPYWNIVDRHSYSPGVELSEDECKTACTTETKISCQSVYYHTLHKSCWCLAVSAESYFTPQRDPWYSRVYILSCK